MPQNQFDILERLSSRAKSALVAAQKLAETLGHEQIGPEHLLYGITEAASSFATEVVLKHKITSEQVRREIIIIHALETFPSTPPSVSQQLQRTMEKAAIYAQKFNYPFIGTEHLLLALVDLENPAKEILKKLDFSPEEIQKNIQGVLEHYSRLPEMLPTDDDMAFEDQLESGRGAKSATLDYFTSDITAKAKSGKIDPLIGREQEIERVVSILNRRNKNNPVLIGEPGVGKTAIVEGLALAISKKEVPDFLLDKKILYLDLALVVAGSMFRGEFENRLKQIIEEVKNNSNIILFIDELHTMIGAGATTGSLDAANILKPALARGEISMIGATTFSDYKKHIESDPALERRFQPILVEEPSVAQAKAILRGLRPFYEKHHQISITDEALDLACELSARYITDRFLPDKALDLIDESAARIGSRASVSPKKRELLILEEEIQDLENKKNRSVLSQDFEKASQFKILLADKRKQFGLSRSRFEKQKIKQREQLTGEHIAATVSSATKIPLNKLLNKEAKRLSSLEKELQGHVIGQKDVLSAIASTIRRSRTGISSPSRPMGSFLFLGPTGVGKTETAKVLAREVFGSEKDLVRVDMSEFMERHNISRLLGAPAGYVGYEEGGRLTETIRRKPFAVVLFDEIEKAHPDVFNILLQLLEEGELTDGGGRKINFRNTIVILTSNIGGGNFNQFAIGFAERSRQEKNQGLPEYEKIKDNVMQSLHQKISPELLNRIDHIAVFRPLGHQEMRDIVRLELKKTKQRLNTGGIDVEFHPDVFKYIHKISFDPKQGARKVRRSIQEHIENLISEHLLAKNLPRPTRLKITADKESAKPLKIATV